MQTSHKVPRSWASGRRCGRAAAAVAAVVVISAAATGCGDDDTKEPSASEEAASAASAAASAAGKVQQGLESAASAIASATAAAPSALASASASVASELAKIRNGVDAKADVAAGRPQTDSDGRTTTKLTVKNSSQDPHDYLVQINFRNAAGDVLDTVLLSVKDVKAGASKEATARSTYPLTGATAAEVANALRRG